jgi:hypothetical protein
VTDARRRRKNPDAALSDDEAADLDLTEDGFTAEHDVPISLDD